MPKKKNQETQAQQSERFKKAVRELIDAGELNPTEADSAFDALITRRGLTRESRQGARRQGAKPERESP